MRSYDVKVGNWRLEAWWDREAGGYKLYVGDVERLVTRDELCDLFNLLKAAEQLEGGP